LTAKPRGLALLLALALAGCAAAPADKPAVQPSPLEVKLEQARQLGVKKDYRAADQMLDGVLSHPDFPKLSEETRGYALNLAGAVALDLGNPAKALLLLRQASGMAGRDTAQVWRDRLRAAYEFYDYAESANTLVTIARRWPETLGEIPTPIINQILSSASEPDFPVETRFRLLQALYDANWRTNLGFEPDWVWYPLAVLQLERGESEKAAATLQRVMDPMSIVKIRVDRRFDALPLDREVALDVHRALQGYVAKARDVAAEHPKSLEALRELTYALLTAKQFDEVLAITEPFRLDLPPNSTLASKYEDWGEYIDWIVSDRARALRAKGRVGEALPLMRQNAKRIEDGHVDVGHVVGLAYVLVRHEQPREALEALDTITRIGKPSLYGRMRVEGMRLRAALALKDQPLAERALKYLREHEIDAPATLQSALIETGRHDEAAKLLAQRLADPLERGDALEDLQDFYELPATKVVQQWRKQWKVFMARRDVRAAIDKVGRIERYPFLF
jgi:tetratricopeptide (TPR) repeat protein